MKLGCQARSFGEGVYPDEKAFLAVMHQIGGLGFEGIEARALTFGVCVCYKGVKK